MVPHLMPGKKNPHTYKEIFVFCPLFDTGANLLCRVLFGIRFYGYLLVF